MGLGSVNSGLVSNFKKENILGWTKCGGESVTGEVCKMRFECHRYTFVGNEYRQAYFEDAPVKNGLCEWFVDNTDCHREKCYLQVEIVE